MNNRNREKKKNTSTTGVIIAVVVWIILSNLAGAGNVGTLVFTVIFLAIAGFAVASLIAKKKGGAKHGSVYSSERAREKAKQIFMKEEYEEEAVKCTHPRGREKYFAQLDGFLANGIIDKSEYRVLKERYEKLNIPDNMH